MFIKVKGFPFGSYAAIMLFGLVFHKKELSLKQKRHERIHLSQFAEMVGVGLTIATVLSFAFQMFWSFLVFPLFLYYAWYLTEFFIRLCLYRNWDLAYKSISLEQEAYYGSLDPCYGRYSFIWLKNLFLKYDPCRI